MELLRKGADQLSQEWASKLHCQLPNFGRTSGNGKRPSERVEDLESYLAKLQDVENTVSGYDKRAFGGVFVLNCRQPLQWLAAERAERREALSRELHDEMQDCVRGVEVQLGRNEALLGIELEGVSPENLVELERFTAHYEGTHKRLLGSLRDAREAFEALEALRASLTQHDVSALWRTALEASEHAQRVADVRGRLWIVKPGVIAGVRQKQGRLLEAAKTKVAATAGFEGFEDLEAAAEYQAVTTASLGELTTILEEARKLQVQEALLGIEQLPECLKLLTPAVRKVRFCADVWGLASEFIFAQWNQMEAPFKQLNVGRVHLQVAEFADRIDELGEKSGELAQSPVGGVLRFLEAQVRELLREMPLLAKLRHPGVRQRHWEELGPALGDRFVETGRGDPSLAAVLALRLSEKKGEMTPVLERAIQEYAQEVCLEKMEEELRQATVDVAQDLGGLEVRGLGEIEALLGEQMVAIGSLLSSPFAKAFEGMARTWRERLGHLGTCLGELERAQEGWKTLEPVFRWGSLLQGPFWRD
jgi:dynein heavy chain